MANSIALLAIAFAAAVAVAAAAKVPAPSTGPDCQDLVLGNLAMCLAYVQDGSNATKPESECCSGLSTLLRTAPACLCQFLGNSSLTAGFGVSAARALALPAACGVRTPPLSSCNALGYHVTIESPAPAPSLLGSGASPMMSTAPAPAPGSSSAPAPESSPDSGCVDVITNQLIPCFDYAAVGSNVTKASKDCCSNFTSLVRTKPLCLCELVAANSTFADVINKTKALTLPAACNVQIPSLSLCTAAGYPVESPGMAPMPPPDECSGVLVTKLEPCLSYVGNGSTATRPGSDCCTGYSSLVASHPSCLCKLLINSSDVLPGLTFDPLKAVKLPGFCNSTIPRCSGNNTSGDGSVCPALAIDNMVPCLDYIMEGSRVRRPASSCCFGFGTIIDTKPLCLCELLANNSTFASQFAVNRTQALTLPSVCNVATPNVSLCQAAGYQVGKGPAPTANRCTGVLVEKLEMCISYVQTGSNRTDPSPACCSGFSALIASEPDCICEFITNSTTALPGLDLDLMKAATLTSKCNATLPPCTGGSPFPTGSPPLGSGIQNMGLFNLAGLASLLVALLSAF